MHEEWKLINGTNDYYVSNFGHVKKVTEEGETEINKSYNKYGYLYVNLKKNNKRTISTIHLLVWDAFGDKRREGFNLQVDHIDGDKDNNRIDNLQLLTPRENTVKYWRQKRGKKFPGVRKYRDRYAATLKIGKESYWLGIFGTETEAYNQYKNAVRLWEEHGIKPKRKTPKYYYYDKNKNKWIACVRYNKDYIIIGKFNTEKEAAEKVKRFKLFIELKEEFANFL